MVRGTQAQDLFNQIMGKTMTLMIVRPTSVRHCFGTSANHFWQISEKCRNLHSGLLRHNCHVLVCSTDITLSNHVPQTMRSGFG